ncbi:uncharacterized protein LOC134823585 [Bolinopsis microptera]|uniref:uncharacterized protein LOC134823585 n=1 Tax=Bolinopsis microptera TaxID=2820187 RepID=UPI0030792AD4
MLLLLAFLISTAAGDLADLSAYHKCTKVNGISGACNLRLNYFTLAGTHNSGAGANGLLYWYSGLPAPSCLVRNQDKSITEQLELGIRYFDLDLAHISEDSGDWWEKGLVLAHCNENIGCAYSHSLKRALLEIEEFMGQNRDEIVLIRFKDHAETSREYIKKHMANEILSIFRTSSKVRINPDSNPRLGDAITSNKRLLIHTNGGFWMGKPFNSLSQVESFRGGGATSACFSKKEIMDVFKSDWYRVTDDYFPVQVDWYFTFGLCLWDLAGLCDGTELHTIVQINRELVHEAHRPVNLVLIDYAGRGVTRLSEFVREINEENVKIFT